MWIFIKISRLFLQLTDLGITNYAKFAFRQHKFMVHGTFDKGFFGRIFRPSAVMALGSARWWEYQVTLSYVNLAIYSNLIQGRKIQAKKITAVVGREPWSSGHGRRLMFKRLWVWIPELDGHDIFHIDLL